MENHQILIGTSSISMGHGFHSKLLNSQRASCIIWMGMESSYWPLESPNQWGANNLEIVEETISTSPLASWKHHQLPYVPLLLGLAGLLGGHCLVGLLLDLRFWTVDFSAIQRQLWRILGLKMWNILNVLNMNLSRIWFWYEFNLIGIWVEDDLNSL